MSQYPQGQQGYGQQPGQQPYQQPPQGQQPPQQYGQQQQQHYPPPPGGTPQGATQYPPPPTGTSAVHPPQQGYQQQPAHQQQVQHQQGQPAQQVQFTPHADAGAFQGGSYTVTHRDTNAILTIDLQNAAIKAKPGAMIHMASTVQITGEVKFSMKKMFTGGEMKESTFQGRGKVALAPTLFGDIVTLNLDGRTKWKIGKDAYLACTTGVVRETKSQGFSKTMFSGEDLFIYHVNGQGIMWLTSFGAVDRLDLQPGEQHIVDNGHLVAWSCDYKIEKAGGGTMASLKTGEGYVCRFVGPGSVYVQTRNVDEFEAFIRAAVPKQQ